MAVLPQEIDSKLSHERLVYTQHPQYEGRLDMLADGDGIAYKLVNGINLDSIKDVKEILEKHNIGIYAQMQGTPVLLRALENSSSKEVAKFLLNALLDKQGDRCAIINSFGVHPINDALMLCLDYDSDFDDCYRNANWDMARTCIKLGADINRVLAVQREIRWGCYDKSSYHVSYDATFLLEAWCQENQEAAKQLILLGANIQQSEDVFKKRFGVRPEVAERVSQQIRLSRMQALQASTQSKNAVVLNTDAALQPLSIIFSKPSTPKGSEQKLEMEFDFAAKTDCEIVTDIVQRFNLPVTECDCPAFRREKKDNVRDYIPTLLLQKLQEQSWPKVRAIIITDIGAGDLKQAATIACALVRAGYSVNFNLIDSEYRIEQEKCKALISAFEKILEILNNTFTGKAVINAHAGSYNADQHKSDFLLVIDGIGRLRWKRQVPGELIYKGLCQQAKEKNPKVLCVATRENCYNVTVLCNDIVEKQFKYEFPKVSKVRRNKILGGSSDSDD